VQLHLNPYYLACVIIAITDGIAGMFPLAVSANIVALPFKV
jgi:hypothetical protein